MCAHMNENLQYINDDAFYQHTDMVCTIFEIRFVCLIDVLINKIIYLNYKRNKIKTFLKIFDFCLGILKVMTGC
jgi:hypothetical protein